MVYTWDPRDPFLTLDRGGEPEPTDKWYAWGQKGTPPQEGAKQFEHTWNPPTIWRGFRLKPITYYTAVNYLIDKLYSADIHKLDLKKHDSKFKTSPIIDDMIRKFPWFDSKDVPYHFRTQAQEGWISQVSRDMGENYNPSKKTEIKPHRPPSTPKKPKKTDPWPLHHCITRFTTFMADGTRESIDLAPSYFIPLSDPADPKSLDLKGIDFTRLSCPSRLAIYSAGTQVLTWRPGDPDGADGAEEIRNATDLKIAVQSLHRGLKPGKNVLDFQIVDTPLGQDMSVDGEDD